MKKPLPIRPLVPMRIYRTLEAFRPDPSSPLILALGNFDGIHRGHQDIFQKAARRARELNGRFAIFTFSDHPQGVLHPEKKPELLTPLPQKLILFETYGPELCFLIPFTKEFSMTEADVFIEKVLVRQLGVKQVFLGFNAGFGHDRKGNAALMETSAKKFGFHFEAVPPFKIQGQLISSSQIREWIRAGDWKKTEEGLGRPFSILAPVITGDARGRELGYPTANLDISGRVLPPEGVYAVKARTVNAGTKPLGSGAEDFQKPETGPWREAVLNYGKRPTFEQAALPVMEAHILDSGEDLYGKTLEVSFSAYLRGEKKFQDAGMLRAQIEKDIRQARDIFAASVKA